MGYTEITQAEFEDMLNRNAYKWKLVPDSYAKENIYLIESDGIFIKIFSSLVNGVSRSVGADAVRTVGWDPMSNLPVMSSESRVYRTEGWRQHLVERIESVKEKMKGIEKCKICGGVMVERENKKTKEKFMGCLNWKNHQKNFGHPKVDGQSVGGREFNRQSNVVDMFQSGTIVGNKPSTLGDNVVGMTDGVAGTKDSMNTILSSFQDKMRGISEKLNIRLHEIKGDEPLMETKSFKYGNYPFEKFNVIQSNVAKYVDEDTNVVIEAKTSTGKTIMGELFMWKVLGEGKKVIYTSPLKALTREKWDAWGKKFGGAGYKLAIVTGDYRLTDKRIRELNESNIILCTSEMLDHRTRNMTSEKSLWLVEAGLLIVDEVQLIGMPERGDKLEAGLMRFTKINPACKLIFLSGTMPNSGEIAGWLRELNGKDTVLIRSGWRPVKLNMVYVQYNDTQGYYAGKANLFEKVIGEVVKHKDDKILIFVHSKTDGRKIMNILAEKGYKAEFHNADLEVDDRVNIEESFKDKTGGVRIIIATSTLAYGLNLPARIVIICGMHRGLDEVSELDIIQMCGRSGRMGIDTEGDAVIILPETGFGEFKRKIENPGDIISQINDPSIAEFHVIGEIVGRTIMTRQDVNKWFSRTLASKQMVKIDNNYVDKLIDDLIKNEAIKEVDVKIEEGGEVKIIKRLVETELGKACTYFYLRPDMLKDMMDNWSKLFEKRLEGSDFLMSLALSKLRMFEEVIVSKDERGYIGIYQNASKATESIFGVVGEGQCKIGMTYLNMIKGVKGVEIDKEGKKVMNPLASVQRGLQQDVERIFQALAYIDAKFTKWNKGSYWGVMGMRMKYGIGPELVALCSLEGVGGTFAKRLYDGGIKQPIELVTKRIDAIKVLGARYDGIIGRNKEMFTMLGFKVEEKKVEQPKVEQANIIKVEEKKVDLPKVVEKVEKETEYFVGKDVATITGKKGKIIWVREKIIAGLPSIIVEFEGGQKQDYTPDQFDKVFKAKGNTEIEKKEISASTFLTGKGQPLRIVQAVEMKKE